MRKHLSIFFSLLFLFAVQSQAQIRKIPAEVTEAFQTLYPHAEKVEWRDALSYFEATFILNNVEITSDFDSEGNVLKSEKKISFDALPATIKDGFKKSRFTDWELVSVHEVDKNQEGIQYRIFVKKNAVQKKYLFFNTDGRLIREALKI